MKPVEMFTMVISLVQVIMMKRLIDVISEAQQTNSEFFPTLRPPLPPWFGKCVLIISDFLWSLLEIFNGRVFDITQHGYSGNGGNYF